MATKYTSVTLQHLGFRPLIDFDVLRSGASYVLQWHSDHSQPTDQDLANAELPAAKGAYKNQIRSEANKLILSKWPDWKQRNCDAGIYPEVMKTEKDADVVAVINASNTAEDAVDAALTIADVEAVSAIWPVL